MQVTSNLYDQDLTFELPNKYLTSVGIKPDYDQFWKVIFICGKTQDIFESLKPLGFLITEKTIEDLFEEFLPTFWYYPDNKVVSSWPIASDWSFVNHDSRIEYKGRELLEHFTIHQLEYAIEKTVCFTEKFEPYY